MKSKLLTICNFAGCGKLIPRGEIYCEKHKHKANSEKHWSYQWKKDNYGRYGSFYHSWRWKKVSKEYRKTHYWCVMCLKRGLYRKADVVDHIVPIRAIATKDGKKINGWSKRWDWSNYEALCNADHAKKTRAVDETKFILDDYRKK